MSCKAVSANDQVNAQFAKLLIGCGASCLEQSVGSAAAAQVPRHHAASLQLACCKRPLRELVLCSRLPASRHQLRTYRDPEDVGSHLVEFLAACDGLPAAQARLASLSAVTLQVRLPARGGWT